MDIPAEKQLHALVMLSRAIVETVKECGQAPVGHIYAAVLPSFPNMTADDLNRLIEVLVKMGKLKRTNHLLTPGDKP